MKKYKILPLIAITTLTGVTFSLVSCNKGEQEPDFGPLCFTDIANDNINSTISYDAHELTVGVDKEIDIEYTYTPDVDTSWQKWELKEGSTLGKDLTLENGQSIYVRNTKDKLSLSLTKYFQFVMSGKIAASGDVDSLVNYAQLSDYCFSRLFYNCVSLTQAPELPAKRIADSCYYNMFYGCTSLVKAPDKLPATTLAEWCYGSMFDNCSSLIKAPELPATTMASCCYTQMFKGCSLLSQVPAKLPAMSLAEDCYMSMFYGCQSLTTAPQLPATQLAYECYLQMFNNCYKLTTAPDLQATTLAEDCYHTMFWNCYSLTQPPELPATTLVDGCYDGMFCSCESLNVSEDSGAHKFFHCPNTFPESAVDGMFLNAGGTFKDSTPKAGHSYYWN